VPDFTQIPVTYTPNVHRGVLQQLEGEKTRALRKRIIKERRKKGDFNRARDAL
jgi:hypothetical protein